MLRGLLVGVALVGAIGCGSRHHARTSAEAAAQDAVLVSRTPQFDEFVIAAGTSLPVTLDTPVASAVNHVEDRVQAWLRQPLVIDGTAVVPRGSRLEGVVSQRPDNVGGRAHLAIMFNTLVVNDTPYEIATSALTRAPAGTKGSSERLTVRLARPITIRVSVDIS